jgi:hypothetical protein
VRRVYNFEGYWGFIVLAGFLAVVFPISQIKQFRRKKSIKLESDKKKE